MGAQRAGPTESWGRGSGAQTTPREEQGPRRDALLPREAALAGQTRVSKLLCLLDKNDKKKGCVLCNETLMWPRC